MDITNDLAFGILVYFLAVADVFMLIVLGYGIYLFRKTTYDFEQEIAKTLHPKPLDRQTINAVIFWVLIVLFIVFVRMITPEYYL